ncbi:chorismate mutase aro7 [Clydaea vesicula]|uniref:Chorismate mutase n=1 Tax=Clydaea vesicula TaxID=447962 RepID=A0AAD5XYL4_9FUNG|nr:chorismate mutase aro7 [Clydaea vesicula]KAJ3383351.1 chorismate mutase aro7 [Lobulomyces angularis]
MNFTKKNFTLDHIRQELVRLEDSIIFALIERSQFQKNDIIYKCGGINIKEFDGSFLEYFLHELECAHAKVRRYTSPDETPFTTNLPDSVLPPIQFPKLLVPNNVNINDQLMKIYINEIVPKITDEGDDGNHGSAATKDCHVLQLLSRRIHFGKFVAEAKFNDPLLQPKYIELIRNKDKCGINDLLTNLAVEEKLLRRLRRKAAIFGAEIDGDGIPTLKEEDNKIPLDVVCDMYEKYVIPLTKVVEVEYLLERLKYYPSFVPEF